MLAWSYVPLVQFAVLGPLLVRGAAGPIVIAGAKERAVLARLLASRSRAVSTAELVDAVWGEDAPRSAVKSVQTFVLHLRDALEPEREGAPRVLVTDGPGYRLAVEAADVDAERFCSLVAAGRQALDAGRAPVAAATFAEALALWRGPAYAGFEALPFACAEARRLEELRLSAVEGGLEARLALGAAALVAADLEPLVQQHPFREQLWRLLVLALYRDGRQGDALAAYDRARRGLRAALGVDPGPELRALHGQVLAQDPVLLEPVRRPVDLPPGLRPTPGPFLGREGELTTLREAWRRAAARPVTVAVRGPAGAGASRLVAELAAELAQAGVPVELVGAAAPISGDAPGQLVARPGLLVVDGGGDPVPVATGSAGLVVVLADATSAVRPGVEAVDLTPLEPAEVRALVATHVAPADVDAATAHILRQVGGWPGPVHAAAAGWARRVAAERVEVAAVSTARAVRQLAAVRGALVDGVVELGETLATACASPGADCPWRGLASYDVADASWFAGRERLVAELVARLAGSRLLAVVGASGSGKSSLVAAGLLAALEQDALPGSASWTPVRMRPGEHPMSELARLALGARASAGDVGDVLERMLRGDEADGRCSLLVVDQLEEVWSTCTDPGERAAFLTLLADLAADERSPVRLVLVLRADFVGHLTDQPRLAAAAADGTVLVSPLTEPELRRAVELPAARCGLDLDVGLVDALVADAGTEPGVLPLLSTSLRALWERREGQRLTLAAYVERGGLSGAIARLADEAVSGLDDRQREAVRVLLLRLAGPGGADSVARRRVRLDELAQLPDPQVLAMVDPLVDARLLTVAHGTVEVAHEALFREWPLLRSWLDQDLSGRAVLRRLTQAAVEWDAEGRDPSAVWTGARLAVGVEAAAAHADEVTALERSFLDAGTAAVERDWRAAEERAATAARQNARLRSLLRALVLVLVLALGAGAAAVWSRGQAVAASSQAEARRLAAAAVNEDYLDLALLEAVEAVRGDPGPETEGALLSLLGRVPDVVTQVRTRHRFLGLTPDSAAGVVYLHENEPRLLAVDAADGGLRWTAELESQPDAVAPHRAGLLVTTSPQGRISLAALDPGTGRPRWRMPLGDGRPPGLGFGPEAPLVALADGRVAVALRDALVLVDPDRRLVVDRLPWGEPVEPVRLLLLDRDRLLVSRFEGATLLLDLAARSVVPAPLPGRAVSLSPDGRRLATASDGPRESVLQLLETDGFTPVTEPLPLPQLYDGDAWSPDGSLLVVSTDGVLQVRDGRSGALRRELRGHSGTAFGLSFVGQEGSRLWSAGRDGTALLWDVSGREGVARTADAEVGTYLGDVAGDGRTAVAIESAQQGPRAHLVAGDTGRRSHGPLPLPASCACTLWAVAMVPDGRTALGGLERAGATTPTGALVVWDTGSGSVRGDVALPWPAWSLAVTPDSRRAVVNGTGGWAVVDLLQRRVVGRPEPDGTAEPMEITRSAAVSPDGRLAALGRQEGRLLLVDTSTGRLVREAALPDGDEVVSLAWSSDGTTVLVGTDDGYLRLYRRSDLSPSAPARLITDGWVIDVRVDPTGRYAATVGTDGELLLWDAASWRPLGKRLTDGLDWGWASFARDGSQVRTHHAGGELVTWSTDARAWVRAACRIANRELSADEWELVHPGQPWRPTCGKG